MNDSTRQPRIAMAVLAAGLSTRMGENKLLLPIGGVAMVRRVASAALASRVARVLIVTGHDAPRVREALADLDVAFVPNPDHLEGMGSSVRAAARAVDGNDAALAICPGDMPYVTAGTIDALIAAWRAGPPRFAYRPVHEGRPGHPVLFDASAFAELRRLGGSEGARHLLRERRDAVAEVPVDCPGVLLDLDTREDLRASSGAVR